MNTIKNVVNLLKDKVITETFEVLTKDYKCVLSYESEHGDRYVYDNVIFKVSIYEFEELGDLDINIVYGMKNYHIDPYLEQLEMMTRIESKPKAIKGFFYKNYSRDFWNAVSMIIKERLVQLGIGTI